MILPLFRPHTGTNALYDEIVIFQESHILPFAMVTIKEAAKLTSSPHVHSPSSSSASQPKGWKTQATTKWTPEDVAEWMSTLHLSKEHL